MSIRKTIITTVVALTLVAMVAPGVAQGVTIDELLAQITQLQAQLLALQGGTTTPSGSVPAACTGITLTRNLIKGSTGSDVKCVQALLNTDTATRVAISGVGSAGSETTTYGSLTVAAVKKFQAKYGTGSLGTVGAMTRAKMNLILTGGTVVIPGNPPVTPTGSISASLAADNPPAGAIIGGQATADLLHINFTGTGNVTSVTLQRSGISDQNLFTNVYLYDGATRITDGYSFNIGGQTVMNGLSITVNGSKTISVKGDVMASASTTQGSAVVALTSYTGNGAVTSANVTGNTMAVVSGTLATAGLGAQTVALASVNAGVTGYTFWSAPLQINTRTVLLKAASFKMVGSAPSDALSNIKLFIDGVDTGKLATVTSIASSNYAVFDLTSAPLSLATGSHTIDLRANVEKGTNRDVTVSVQQAADLMVFDPQVGVNIAVGGPGNNATTAVAFTANTAGKISISTGSVTVNLDPTFTSQTNIAGGSTNAIIGRFIVHAYGEDVKVNSLVVTPKITSATSTGGTCTTAATTGLVTTANGTCGMNNVTLYFNGSQVGSQANWAPTTASLVPLTFTLGSQMIAPAGQDSILEIRSDLQTAASVNYLTGTVIVTLPLGVANAQGQSSQATVVVPPAAVATTGLAIQTGQLVVSKSSALANYTTSPNTSNVKIGSYIIQNQSTSQAIRLTSLSIATTTTTATINNFSSLRTSNTTGSGATPIMFSGDGTGLTSTDVFSINDTLPIGGSITLDIFANAGSTAGTIATTLNVSYIGAVDNISATSGIKTGQTVTFGVGTITNPPTLVVSSTTPAQYIAAAGGAEKASQATFNFVSTSGNATISELRFTVTGTDAIPSQTVTNVCVGTVCASPTGTPGTAVLGFTTPLVVPNGGGGLTQSAKVSYANVGTGGVVPGFSSTIALAYVKYNAGGTTKTLGSLATCTTALGAACDATLAVVDAPIMTLEGSKPTVVVNTTSNAGFSLTVENKIGEVTVTADSKGAIKLNDIKFAIGTSNITNPTLTLARIADGSTTITGSSCGQGVDHATSQTVFCEFGTGTKATETDIINTEVNTDYDGYLIEAGTSKTFSLYATVDGTITVAGSPMTISSSVNAAGFNWDDTSYNGLAGTTLDLNLTGTLIYNFPSGSYSIHN